MLALVKSVKRAPNPNLRTDFPGWLLPSNRWPNSWKSMRIYWLPLDLLTRQVQNLAVRVMRNWMLATLPEVEKDAMLKLSLTGHAQQVESKLNHLLLAWRRDQPSGAMPAMPRRKVADLHRLAASAGEVRKKQAAIQRKNAEAERQAKRETYLRTLAADFNRCWRNADKRAERGIASAYDEIKRSLVELSDAYALCATRADFDRRLAKFMARHAKRSALVRRLIEAGLWQKSQ